MHAAAPIAEVKPQEITNHQTARCRCGHPLKSHENDGGACWDCCGTGNGCGAFRAAPARPSTAPAPFRAVQALQAADEVIAAMHELAEGEGLTEAESHGLMDLLTGLVRRAQRELGAEAADA